MLQHDDSHPPVSRDEATSAEMRLRNDQPATVWPPQSAINDSRYETAATASDDIDAWARHAFATNGFGDGGFAGLPTAERRTAERPTSYALHRAARVHRSFQLGEIIVALFDAIVAAVFAVRAVHTRHPKV